MPRALKTPYMNSSAALKKSQYGLNVQNTKAMMIIGPNATKGSVTSV